jgi:hypothetical protein
VIDGAVVVVPKRSDYGRIMSDGWSNHGSTTAVGLGEDRFDATALRAIGHRLRRKR